MKLKLFNQGNQRGSSKSRLSKSLVSTSMISTSMISMSVVAAMFLSPAAQAQTTDYAADQTKRFVHERSSDALDQVNSILCMFDQTKYGDASLLNTGYYTALVDESVCDGRDSSENSNSSSSGGTSASGAREYTRFKVKSERSSALSPQIVSAFVGVNGPDNMPMSIQAKFNITEAASEFNPLGAFSSSYKGSISGVPVPVMRGMIKSLRDSQGRVVIKFGESFSMPGGQELSSVKSALVRNTEGGYGSVYQLNNEQQGPGPNAGPETFQFAYNKTHFARRKGTSGTPECFSRSDFETSAWRYGLYNATSKSRVNVNSGFPINTQADGKGQFGFLGYYGLFLPPGADALGDGSTVYKIEPGEGTSQPVATPYTLVVKNGKLKRHVRSEVTLAALKNIPLEGMLPSPGQGNGGPNGGSMQRITWDGTNLSIIASASPSNGGPPSWTPTNPPQVISSSTTLMFGDLGLYSQALGGQVRIKLSGCTPVSNMNPGLGVTCNTPTGETPVVFFKESQVKPGDPNVPTSLSCYQSCPKAGANGMNRSDQQYSEDGNQRDYTFTDGMLKDGSFNVALLEAPDGQSWGYNSGPLFEANSNNLNALKCPWNPAQTCGWRAWGELSEFFTWETGPNNWNKFTSVRDGNSAVVEFDAPLPVKFVYPTNGTGGANPAEVDQKYAGNTFYLQYGGFGNLQGIPGKCVNPEDPTDTDIDCSKPGRRWVPEFSIPEGATATNDAGTENYLIKPLEVEQRMSKVDSSKCSSIKLVDLSSSWPDLDKEWADPNLGAEPELGDGDKVIAGVIQ